MKIDWNLQLWKTRLSIQFWFYLRNTYRFPPGIPWKIIALLDIFFMEKKHTVMFVCKYEDLIYCFAYCDISSEAVNLYITWCNLEHAVWKTLSYPYTYFGNFLRTAVVISCCLWQRKLSLLFSSPPAFIHFQFRDFSCPWSSWDCVHFGKNQWSSINNLNLAWSWEKMHSSFALHVEELRIFLISAESF